MALPIQSNRYDYSRSGYGYGYDLYSQIFHHTGKRVRAVRHDYASIKLRILFEDDTEGSLREGDRIEYLEILEKPKSFCLSCGEECHVSQFDGQGRCHTTRDKFWQKVRRLFWHRYSKQKMV